MKLWKMENFIVFIRDHKTLDETVTASYCELSLDIFDVVKFTLKMMPGC